MNHRSKGRIGLLVILAMVASLTVGLVGVGSAAAGTAGSHRLRDSDRDGMPNRWERAHGLKVHGKDARKDPDLDGLRNIGEYRNRTRPHRPDTDKDGLYDGTEVKWFETDPKSEDSDGDGIEDGIEDSDDDGVVDEGEDGDLEGFVGTILWFDADTGQLVFESAMGFPVTVLVTDETRIRGVEECEESAGCDLAEGIDIVEMRLLPELKKGVPVAAKIWLDCGGWDDWED
jgi:hypothetical protein